MGAACPKLLPCARYLQTVSPNREVVTFYILVSFFFVSVKKSKGENKWPKTDEKTRFGGNLGF